MALKNSDVVKYSLYGPLSAIGIALPLSYLTAFQTEGLGWSAALAATVLVIPRVIDFVLGVSAGTIMSKINLKAGQYRGWFLIFSWVIGISIILCFLNTEKLPLVLQILCIVVGYVGINGGMNFVFTAQYGIMAKMGGSDMNDRMKLTVTANRFTMATSIITSLITVPLLQLFTKLSYPNNTDPNWIGANGYMFMAFLGGILYFFGAQCIAAGAKPYDPPLAPDAPKQPTLPLGDIIKGVATNDQLLIYVLVSLLTSIGMFSVMPMGIFYYIYVLGNLSLLTIAMTVSMLFGFLASLIGPSIGRKLGKKRSMVIGMAIGIGGSIVNGFVGGNQTELPFQVGGLPVKLGWVLYVAIGLIAALAAQMYAAFAMQYQVDAGEYGYWKTGKDNRTAAFGLGAIPIKIALIVGGIIGGFGLEAIGYKPGMGMPGGPAFPATFNDSFMKLLCWLPAGINILAWLLFTFGYKITDADAAKYAKENMERTMKAAMEAQKSS